MKKFLMTIAAAFVAVSMSAQNEMYVGGTLGFANKDAKTGVKNRLYVAPEFGVKLNDQWGVGAVLSYENRELTGGAKKNTFRFNPYARYYAINIGKFNVFVDGGAYFETIKNESSAGTKTTDTEFGLNVTPGIAYNLTDKISIVAHTASVFNFYMYSPDGGDTGMNVSLPLADNFSVNTFVFGFYYNF